LGDGGSTGGMDDRFDFILVSAPMVEKVESGSYMAYGNDGNHFNQDINSGSNSAVSAEIANALHAASDHLPVVADFDLSISAIESDNDQKYPITFTLSQNYPNPFNPTTIINYELQITNYVTLSVFNITGQKVATLVDAQQSTGSHEVEWDAGDFSSGMYLYVLTVGNEQVVKKMVLIR
jgi:hypothetical protein